MRNLRNAITMLVVAVFVCVFLASPARADEAVQIDNIDLYEEFNSFQIADENIGGGSNLDEAPEPMEEDPEVIYFDYRRLRRKSKDTVVLGYTYSELTLGGGTVDTFDAGREFRSVSWFGYGRGSVRFLTFNLSRSISLQAGVYVGAEGAFFESRYYRGNKVRTSLGIELMLFPNSNRPEWMAMLRLGGAYDLERGYSRDTAYKLDYQHTGLVEAEINLEYTGFFQKTDEFKAWGNQRVKIGWFPVVQVYSKLLMQIDDANRRETFEGPETDNTSWDLQATVMVYGGAWEQGIWRVGPTVGLRLHEANGYFNQDRGTTIVTVNGGAAFTVQLHEHIVVDFNARVIYETDTQRTQGAIGIDVLLFDWGK